jgi:hypothetical protein
MKPLIRFSFVCLASLFVFSEARAQTDSALPRRIVALQYTAFNPQTAATVSPEMADLSVLASHRVGHEVQLAMKFRLKTNWYIVGGWGAGQVPHELYLLTPFNPLSIFSRPFYLPTSRIRLAPYRHVSASMGMEYHHPLGVRGRFVPYLGFSLRYSTFLPDATAPAPLLFRETATGDEFQLEVSYSDTRRSSLGYHLTMGIQWMLGQHIVVAAHVSRNQSNLDILRGSQFRLYDQQTLLRAGTLRQQNWFVGYGLSVGYRW